MDDHEYDAELAANISSEPESSDQEHADQDNRQPADNTLKSNESHSVNPFNRILISFLRVKTVN
jgi:hypothetical protein